VLIKLSLVTDVNSVQRERKFQKYRRQPSNRDERFECKPFELTMSDNFRLTGSYDQVLCAQL
jgi:hypothetical protein